MLDEDIEAQIPLISPEQQNTEQNDKLMVIDIGRMGRIKNIKFNQTLVCDWIIVLVLVVCIVATIVIILYQ